MSFQVALLFCMLLAVCTGQTTVPPTTAATTVVGPCGQLQGFMLQGDVITNETTGETVVDDAIREISALNFADDHGFLKRIAWVESKFGADPNTFTNKNGQPYHGGIWQVDQIGFEDTKNVIAHPALRSKFQEIEDILKIRWSAVDWICLRSPLYSALAARLLLSNVKAPIPSSVESQASYWKKYYNKSGKGKKCKFITDVEELEKKEGQ